MLPIIRHCLALSFLALFAPLMAQLVDLNGVQTEVKYDRLGRLSGQMVIGGVDYEVTPTATAANKTDANVVRTLTPTGGISTKIQLDPLGQLKSYSHGEVQTKIERDLDQRISEIEDGRSGRTLKLNYLNQTKYDYSYTDNLLQSLTTNEQEQRSYSYDSNQRLTQIDDNLRSTPLARYSYSAEDRLETYTDGNEVVTTYTYDKHGHVKKIDISDGPSLAYAYHDNEIASFSATLEEGRIESIAGNDFLLELNWSEMRPGSPMITQIKKAGPDFGEDWDVSYTDDIAAAENIIFDLLDSLGGIR